MTSAASANASKHLVHARVGELDLEMSSLWIDEGLGSRVVWFSPRDAATAARLERLVTDRPDEAVISAVA